MMFVKITINQVFYKLLLTFTHQFSTLISIVFLANSVSTVEFGRVAICLILLQVSFFISEWGIPNYSIELLSKSTKSNKKEFLKTILVFHFLCFLSFVAIYALLIKYVFPDLNFKFYLAFIPSLFFGIFNFAWFFSLINASQKIVTVTIIARCLFLIGLFFLVTGDSDSYKYLIFQGMSFAIIGFNSLYLLIKLGFIDRIPSINHLSGRIFYLKNSSIFFLTNLTDNQFPLIWSFVVSIVGGAPLIFLYTLADQIFRSVIALSVLISQTIRINLSFKSKSNLFFTINFFIFFGIIFSLIGYYYIQDFLSLFFNDDFRDPIRLTSLIILPAALHYFIRLLNYPLLAEYYDIKFANKISINVFYFSLILLGSWALFFESLLILISFISLSLIIHLALIIFFLWKAIKVK